MGLANDDPLTDAHRAQVVALNLNARALSDAGLPRMADEELDLSNTEATSGGLGHLAGLRSLRSLDLANTVELGDGLSQLTSLPALQTLDLSVILLQDKHLQHLEGCAVLLRLNPRVTQVSDAGVRRLQLALPGCAVVWQFAAGGSRRKRGAPRPIMKA